MSRKSKSITPAEGAMLNSTPLKYHQNERGIICYVSRNGTREFTLRTARALVRKGYAIIDKNNNFFLTKAGVQVSFTAAYPRELDYDAK